MGKLSEDTDHLVQLLVNVDPSLAPTKSNGTSRSSKVLKSKPSQNAPPQGSKRVASPYKLGDLGASPLGIDHALASAPPVSPLLNSGPTPSSTASTPERSPGSILRVSHGCQLLCACCKSMYLFEYTTPLQLPAYLQSICVTGSQQLRSFSPLCRFVSAVCI